MFFKSNGLAHLAAVLRCIVNPGTMSSQRRKTASRANGARSLGPKTPAGRRRSALNATRHGLLARCVLLSGESPEAFHAMLAEYTGRFVPADAVECGFIEEMAAAFWRLRRTWAVETASTRSLPATPSSASLRPFLLSHPLPSSTSSIVTKPASTACSSALSTTSFCSAGRNRLTNRVPSSPAPMLRRRGRQSPPPRSNRAEPLPAGSTHNCQRVLLPAAVPLDLRHRWEFRLHRVFPRSFSTPFLCGKSGLPSERAMTAHFRSGAWATPANENRRELRGLM